MNTLKNPIIEIHGTGTHNRGAELMAIAISEKIKSVYPAAKIAVPSTFGTQQDIKRYGFYTTCILESKRSKHIFSLISGILSGNIINPIHVNTVLDASGFAFSDQWGVGPARKLVKKMARPYRKHQKIVLLPQALGAFEDQNVKKYTLTLFQRAALVFARDNQSYGYSHALIPNQQKLRKYPDFTLLVKPVTDLSIKLPVKFACIVPNIRMLDKFDHREDYLEFLRQALSLVESQGITPMFLIHDGEEDARVVDMLQLKHHNYVIVSHEDPRILKWILGQSQFVIGSRFHALVSSLSQGVPCIGAGWSHKYPELFNDFSTRETLIDDLKDIQTLEKYIRLLADPTSNKIKSDQIQQAANSLKSKVEEMWELILLEIEKLK